MFNKNFTLRSTITEVIAVSGFFTWMLFHGEPFFIQAGSFCFFVVMSGYFILFDADVQ